MYLRRNLNLIAMRTSVVSLGICLSLFILINCQISLFAQRLCGTPQVIKSLQDTSLSFIQNKGRLDEFQKAFLKEIDELQQLPVITIPVVVHVVYKNAKEKISEQRVAEQIRMLKEDFRAQNSDVSIVPSKWKYLVSDTNIEFRLAVRTPDDKPTNGIVYVQTSTAQFTMESENVKKTERGGNDPWDPEHYLNIWVCDLAQFLGYAMPPGTDGQVLTDLDGVVIRYDVFGRNSSPKYGLGRTLTHEVGHWLNLNHLWGNCPDLPVCCSSCSDDDGLKDTPTQLKCNEGAINPNNQPKTCGNDGDLWVNYLDYVDDKFMVMFTPEQSKTMFATLQSARREILKSKALIPITRTKFFFFN